KVNANLGTSPDHADLQEELLKLRLALEAGADAVMDLSTGGNLDEIRRTILRHCPVPLGTVPIYQAAVETAQRKGAIVHMTLDDIFEVIERQARDGVDFMTVHCGLTFRALERLKKQGRVTGIVSRGGAFLATWMIYNDRENPLYEYFDRLLEIAKKYDVTLSLGDGLRPGSLADATDRVQLEELLTLGELVEEAWKEGVQVMVEGPGHVPLDQIEANVKVQKRVCRGAPFYVLGPLVTDIAPGYDHIACAIGGALAAYHGADFLCYVTPAEHLRLPKPEDVREGVIAARIAAHAADLARGRQDAWQRDLEMSRARSSLDWKRQMELCIDPLKAQKLRAERLPTERDVCTMCGKFCAIKLVKEYLRG
ncbi:MAG: phosphomethylpyrimidine synthase, partial [Deltaproteobacteria bacterium]